MDESFLLSTSKMHTYLVDIKQSELAVAPSGSDREWKHD